MPPKMYDAPQISVVTTVQQYWICHMLWFRSVLIPRWHCMNFVYHLELLLHCCSMQSIVCWTRAREMM